MASAPCGRGGTVGTGGLGQGPRLLVVLPVVLVAALGAAAAGDAAAGSTPLASSSRLALASEARAPRREPSRYRTPRTVPVPRLAHKYRRPLCGTPRPLRGSPPPPLIKPL